MDSLKNSASTQALPPVTQGSQSNSEPIRLEIRGLGPVPSKKNQWEIHGIQRIGPDYWRGQPSIGPSKKLRTWVKQAVASIVSQLQITSQTRKFGITTECLQRFSIASLPHDDCWTVVEIGAVKTVLVPKGQEGADILIEEIE